jgi:hypothetical protein
MDQGGGDFGALVLIEAHSVFERKRVKQESIASVLIQSEPTML